MLSSNLLINYRNYRNFAKIFQKKYSHGMKSTILSYEIYIRNSFHWSQTHFLWASHSIYLQHENIYCHLYDSSHQSQIKLKLAENSLVRSITECHRWGRNGLVVAEPEGFQPCHSNSPSLTLALGMPYRISTLQSLAKCCLTSRYI